MKGFLRRNSPLIFAAISTVGLIATTVTAVKATPRALKLCEALRLDRVNDYQPEPTKIEYMEALWKEYILSIIIGAATTVCIFGSATLNKKQIVALTSAYALLDKAYHEYREKVKSELGEDTDVRIRKSIAEDNFKNYKPSDSDEPVLFYDPRVGYFESYVDFVTLDDGLECFLIDVPSLREINK